jgi:prolyl 4-hydroxylase
MHALLLLLLSPFLTEECDAIIAKATPRLQRSHVVSSDKSDKKHSTVEELSDIRTSQGMFFERGEDDLIRCERGLVC